MLDDQNQIKSKALYYSCDSMGTLCMADELEQHVKALEEQDPG
jgi:hypothetical protein